MMGSAIDGSAGLRGRCIDLLREGWNLDWAALRFLRGDEALTAAFLIAMLSVIIYWARRRKGHPPGRTHMVLPALFQPLAEGSGSFSRRLAITLAFAGLPFFLLALADPYTTVVKQEVRHVGRRILILLDGSGSMGGGTYGNRFEARAKLKARSSEPFYTAAAAAEYFVRTRMKSGYQDLVGLIVFGDESYILSPFSSDYENVLTGIRLFSEPEEYKRFDDAGTKIAMAITQAVGLFKTFAFLKASGNVIVLISDGEDTQVQHEGRSLESILAESSEHKIPVFFIRTVSGKPLGDPATHDALWGAAVEKTGGKLYAGADEDAVIRACEEINRAATGSIQYSRYAVRIPQFPFFALAALFFWLAALALWSLFRRFRTFP